jgi:hypothetical protein
VREIRYVRFQGTARNRHGRFPGVFGLVNGLAGDGRLTEAQETFRRANNAWYDANLANPTSVDPAVYDRDRHPGAAAWFTASAGHLIDRVRGYLEILDAHGIGWQRTESADPGRIGYADADQVVVVDHPPVGG